MTRRIIYTRPDGGMSVVYPCRNTIGDEKLTNDEIFQRAWKRLPPEAINPITLTVEQIPADRTFRNAWEHGGDKVRVNMEQARAIHLARIRIERNEMLTALDIETIKAVGKGDNVAKAAVEVKKQALRDLPQTLDLSQAQTPEELKAIWPAEL